MQKGRVVIVLVIGLSISCKNFNNNKEQLVFKLPQIVNTQFADSAKSTSFEAEAISEVFPVFIGKFKFQDRINIDPEINDTANFKDYSEGHLGNRFRDSIDVNGFELIVDYNRNIKYNRYYELDSTLYNHYPVYFVNSTQTDKIFYGKDDYIFGIQEAIDENEYKEWRPVEGRGFDFCGNGRWGLIVHPHEFVLILMRKYAGDYETQMRVRFKVGENIFVSKAFHGRINENQFFVKDSSYLQWILRETDGEAASSLFLGAIIKEEEWVVKAL